ncbi:hypothetical protein NDA12_002459 [Ustilago hordei]|nr:hypothetical protein NDA15_000431 [Ustilago hordei]KAJ1571769.1 hypothetical protein NDA12_002459 [Ustilago hordei]
MPDLTRYRSSNLASSSRTAGPIAASHNACVNQSRSSRSAFAASPTGPSSALSSATSATGKSTFRPALTVTVTTRHINTIQDAIRCLKPLPSVPTDVDADDDGSELLHHHRPSHNNDSEDHIESDISSASASSAASSSMDPDWVETSLRNQVAKLHIQYNDIDLAQTEAPSVFGLRRRIIAAALDHLSQPQLDSAQGSSRAAKQFEQRGLNEWLAVQSSSSSSGQWKGKILRKKISFGNKKAKASFANQPLVHDPMPASAAASFSESTVRSRSSSMTGSSTSSHDKMLKRDKELAEREANFDLVLLSRFESAELKMQVYTEHRQGNWLVKGPAEGCAKVLDEPPLVFSPWDCQIDSRAIVERKKLRSFIELSDTTCVVRCTVCSSPHHQRLGHKPGWVGCKHCNGTGAVKATYVVCITLRQSTFLPLSMPVRHRAGKHQDAFRSYLPKTNQAVSHIDILRMRSLEAVRSCALRVGRAHHKDHDARLLMAKATLARRSCNSVAVINRTNGIYRVFDITDGGCVRGHAGAGLTDEDSRITETPEIASGLSKLPVTARLDAEGTYRFVDLELVDMASSKSLSFAVEDDAGSVFGQGSGTEDSYSPSVFSFWQRAGGQDGSKDSQTLKGSKDQANRGRAIAEQLDEEQLINSRHNSAASTWSNAVSLHSNQSSKASAGSSDKPSDLSLLPPQKPWEKGRRPNSPNTLNSPALTVSGISTSNSSLLTCESDASGGARDSVKSGSSRNPGTLPAKSPLRQLKRLPAC